MLLSLSSSPPSVSAAECFRGSLGPVASARATPATCASEWFRIRASAADVYAPVCANVGSSCQVVSCERGTQLCRRSIEERPGIGRFDVQCERGLGLNASALAFGRAWRPGALTRFLIPAAPTWAGRLPVRTSAFRRGRCAVHVNETQWTRCRLLVADVRMSMALMVPRDLFGEWFRFVRMRMLCASLLCFTGG